MPSPSEFLSCLSNTYRNSAMRLFFLFFAGPAAVIFCLFGAVYADNLSGGRPARQAQCFLEVKGTHYVGGDCLFAPLDREGSFQITAARRISALVKVKSPERADVSWSGPTGGDAAAVSLGNAFFNGSGCWILFDPPPIPTKTTLVCAWDRNQRLFLGPTPPNPPLSSIAWGERFGMSAQILSSSTVVLAWKTKSAGMTK